MFHEKKSSDCQNAYDRNALYNCNKTEETNVGNAQLQDF